MSFDQPDAVTPSKKKPSPRKRLSLYPLSFEEALKGLLSVPPPPEKHAAKARKIAAKTKTAS